MAADQTILRRVAASLSWQNVDQDGEPAAPSGAVTVGVTRADGTVVKTPGTATVGTGSDARTVALTATEVGGLGVLTATWTDAGDGSTHTTTVDIVGGHLFTVSGARASDAFLDDGTKVSTATILTLRQEITEDFERICDVAFVPRYRREVVTGRLLPTPLVRAVLSIRDYSDATNYTAWTADEIAGITIDGSALGGWKSFYSVHHRLIEWEHGMDSPPRGIREAALLALRLRATRPHSAIPDRATGFSVADGGTYDLATPDAWHYGIPDVDAELQRWSMRVPGIA